MTIYVLGAGGGMGRSVCKTFVREGARVAAVDVNETTLQETINETKGVV